LRRPAVVVQSDKFNQTRFRTLLLIPLTSKFSRTRWPGTVLLPASETGLDRDSVANAAMIASLDRSAVEPAVGNVSDEIMAEVDESLRLVLEL